MYNFLGIFFHVLALSGMVSNLNDSFELNNKCHEQ